MATAAARGSAQYGAGASRSPRNVSARPAKPPIVPAATAISAASSASGSMLWVHGWTIHACDHPSGPSTSAVETAPMTVATTTSPMQGGLPRAGPANPLHREPA